eukprot:TRINITY_DN1713_c0_g1_i1.p1 TRINITY_DN1713_c0_g1~~TRINITY_DN1713_c0_g1_i1.p1  ORF type:complete len:178 (-),score=53.89 TRINITY_DN1713_c0_g1_i1:420-953(-)
MEGLINSRKEISVPLFNHHSVTIRNLSNSSQSSLRSQAQKILKLIGEPTQDLKDSTDHVEEPQREKLLNVERDSSRKISNEAKEGDSGNRTIVKTSNLLDLSEPITPKNTKKDNEIDTRSYLDQMESLNLVDFNNTVEKLDVDDKKSHFDYLLEGGGESSNKPFQFVPDLISSLKHQ